MKKPLTIIVSLVSIALLVWMTMAKSPVPAPDIDGAEPEKITAYLASEDFGKLPAEERAEFMGKLRELPSEKRAEIMRPENVDDDTRAAIRQNMQGMREVMMARMLEDVRAFFKLTPAEQEKHLDARLDEWGSRRRQRPPRTASGGTNGGPHRRRTRDPDQMQKRMQERISDSSAEERAIISEYFKRLMKRRRERNS